MKPQFLLLGGLRTSVFRQRYSIANSIFFDGSSGYLQVTLTTSATHSGSWWGFKTENGTVQAILDNQVYFNASDQLVVNGLTSSPFCKGPRQFGQLSTAFSAANTK